MTIAGNGKVKLQVHTHTGFVRYAIESTTLYNTGLLGVSPRGVTGWETIISMREVALGEKGW